MGRIPDRWKEYSGCGKPIKDVPIFAFKTPLAKKYSAQRDPNQEFVEQEKEFTPADLVKFNSELGYEVVVIVDLTNTFRYYNGVEEFGKNHNIQYEKVKCEGQKIPNDTVMERVANIVSDVIHLHGRNSKKLVGIHCTHGVNRTGYLVARYMIEWLGYEPKNAIEAFNVARGHEMEREAYLDDLKGRTPGNRFEEWKKQRRLTESVNGTGDPMNLWTDFGDDVREPPDDIDAPNKNKNHQYHPYHRHFRGNHQDQRGNLCWRGFHPRSSNYSQRQLRPPFYRGKWAGRTSLKENGFDCNVKFFEDDFIFADDGFSTVTFDNDQFLSKAEANK